MSRFTDSVGEGFAATMGTLLFGLHEALQASEEQSAAYWKAKALELARVIDIKDSTIKKCKNTIETYKGAIANYEEGGNKLLAAREKWRRKQAELTSQLNQVQADLQALQTKYETQQREFKALQTKLEHVQRENDTLSKIVYPQGRDSNNPFDKFNVTMDALFGKTMPEMKRQLEQQQKTLQRTQRELESYQRWHAANLALRCALEVQLLHADPENPLLHDQDLRDRVRRAGEMAMMTLGGEPDPNAPDPLDMAREAGLTFSIPGRPSGVQVLEELGLAELYSRRLMMLNMDGERAIELMQRLRRGEGTATAVRELLRQIEPDSPLLKPETVERVRSIAMEEFQRQQVARRSDRRGPQAAWGATIIGQRQVRERVVDEFAYEVNVGK